MNIAGCRKGSRQNLSETDLAELSKRAGVLVPAEAGSSAGDDDTGEAGQGSSYSDRRAARAALDAISGGAVVDKPGGEW